MCYSIMLYNELGCNFPIWKISADKYLNSGTGQKRGKNEVDSGTFMVYFSSKSNFWIVIKKTKETRCHCDQKRTTTELVGSLKQAGSLM